MGASMSVASFQFSLRWLLAMVTFVAIVCAAETLYGLIGLVLCTAVIVAILGARRIRNCLIRIPLFCFAVVSLWFLVVHLVYDSFECPVCGQRVYHLNIELVTIPIALHEERVPTLIAFMAEDLGIACPHEQCVRSIWDDYWGCFVCLDPQRGIIGLAPSEEWNQWYRTEVRPLLIAAVRENPNLVEEFRENVLVRRDRKYFVNFTDSVLHVPEFK